MPGGNRQNIERRNGKPEKPSQHVSPIWWENPRKTGSGEVTLLLGGGRYWAAGARPAMIQMEAKQFQLL